MCEACAPRYWAPSDGYWTLWPASLVGADRATALVKVGLPAHASAPPAYALWPADGPAHRINVRTANDARALAADLPGPTRVLEQVAPPLWRELGTVRPAPPGERMVEGFVCKASRGPDLRAAAAQLATALREHDRALSAPALARYLDRLDVNWGALTAAQADALLTEARGFLAQASGAALLPAWQRTLDVTVTDLAQRTKAHVRESFAPSVQTSLAQPELAAVRQIGDQSGFFLRDALGRRSAELTARGRAIVQAGLDQGLGRADIGRQLQAQLPDLWRGRGDGYATAVASVATQRARVATEIHTYQEAGIEQLVIVSVLDERTTPQCFPAGTMVRTPSGEVAIERINPRDYVITGRGNRRQVRAVANRNAHELIRLTMLSGRRIMATAEHPILTNRGWVTMGSICSGDHLAIARTTKTRGLDGSNVRALRDKVSGDDPVLCPSEAPLLHKGVLARRAKTGSIQGGPHQELHNLRGGVYGSSRVRKQAATPLLQKMSATTHHPHLSGVRKDLREDSDVRALKVLLHRLPRTVQADDGYGTGGVGCAVPIGDDHHAGKAHRPILRRLCDRGTQGSYRGGRELLARRNRGQGWASIGWTQEEGGRDLSGRIYASPSHEAGNASSVAAGKATDCPRSYSGGIEDHDRVIAIERVPTIEPVYDLQLSGDDPTYIANGVIVHNCRLLDGQVLSVSGCVAHLDRVAAIEQPEDIYTANPFLEIKRDRETGERYMQTRTGTRFAEVLRSGYGTADDRGLGRYLKAGNGMLAANVGPPPYHFRCRTTTEPVLTTVQIPRGYVGRKAEDRAFGLHDPKIDLYPAPLAGRSTVMGDLAPIDVVTLPNAAVQARAGQAALRRSPSPAVVERYAGRTNAHTLPRVAPWAGTTPAGLATDPKLWVGANAFVAVVGTGAAAVLLAAVLANEAAQARDALARVLADGERWARFTGHDCPGWLAAAAAYRRALADPDADPSAAARAFLDAGIAGGWLRLGDSAAAVRFHAPPPRSP